MKEQVEALLTAIGSMAEIGVSYYHAAIESGATMAEAAILTRVFYDAILQMRQNDGGDEE